MLATGTAAAVSLACSTNLMGAGETETKTSRDHAFGHQEMRQPQCRLADALIQRAGFCLKCRADTLIHHHAHGAGEGQR